MIPGPWILVLACQVLQPPVPIEEPTFRIQVVDAETGRGVPLVELSTVDARSYVTDSAGMVAFDDPALMGRRVFFFVKSHGYTFRKDRFGFRGVAVTTSPGGRVRLAVQRVNLAERLYRVTGAGIYGHSVRLGDTPPVAHPLGNGGVLGQDSVHTVLYRGELFWIWGDTKRASYPLGNFHVAAATSSLPGRGGLDPEVGVDLRYFTGPDGFAREMARMPGAGPTWITALAVVRDGGRERLLASYLKFKIGGRGLCEFDPGKARFVHRLVWPGPPAPVPVGHTFHHRDGGVDRVYFGNPFPLVRVRATAAAMLDPNAYEAFTCLKPGTTLAQRRIDRAPDGRPRYAWRRRTEAVTHKAQQDLVRVGALAPGQGLIQLRDRDSGKTVLAHAGSVFFNAFRKRWIAIVNQTFGGPSFLGEIWYAEADEPTGPWVYAAKIVTHDRYSFYNPTQHPEFDAAGGARIYFEGTYTKTFAGTGVHPTPGYDYNQILYALDLRRPGAVLPVPIYVLSTGVPRRFGDGSRLAPARRRCATIAWFAPDRPMPGKSVPVWEVVAGGAAALQVGGRPPRGGRAVFHALDARGPALPTTTPLYEFVGPGGRRAYSIDPAWKGSGYGPGRPIALVWANPIAKAYAGCR